MRATAQPAPGTEFGPCLEESCGHVDCGESRALAAIQCALCGEPIGYDKRFFQNDNWKTLTHLLCVMKGIPMMSTERDLYMRYLGVLGLLAEVSAYLPSNDEGEEMRQQIITAFNGAQKHHPVRWRRILNSLEIYPYDHGPGI